MKVGAKQDRIIGERVMFLNRGHPAFDESLEILCMLSKWPRVRLLADLCSDLGCRSQKHIEAQLTGLQERGFQVILSKAQLGGNGRRDRAAWIELGGHEKAKAAAQAYFAEVYG